MKKLILKGLLLCTLVISCSFNIVLADTTGTTSPTGVLNSNMYNYIDKIDVNFDMQAWHYSGKYWSFSYPDKTKSETNMSYHVDDLDAPYFFKGTSQTMPFRLTERYNLPQSVKDFIAVYGTGQVGTRFNIAKTDMLKNGTFTYNITNNYLYVSFTPIINYDTNNTWAAYNPTVYNKMSYKVYVPWIKAGYGWNSLSCFGGANEFALNKTIVKSAYKRTSDNTLCFTDTEVVNVLGPAPMAGLHHVNNVNSESTFWTGGNNGLYYTFPIKAEFYGMGIRNNGISLTNYEYHASNGRYWVKSGNNFNMNTSAVSIDQNGNNSIDDVVKVNSLHINVSNGTTNGYLDAKTHSSSNSIESEKNASAGSLVNLVSGSGYRSGATLYNTFTTNITGDKDLYLHGLARLVNYPTAGSFSPEYVYKSSEWDGINVSSDGEAPTGTFSPNSQTWLSNASSVVNFNPYDSRSGVKQWRYRISSNNGSTYGAWSNYITGDTTSNITLNATDNVLTQFKIQSEVTDNVGYINTLTSGTYQFDRVNPNGIFTPNSSGWTNKNIAVTFNPSDSGSGVNQWKYRTSTNNGSTWSGWSIAIPGDINSTITLSTQGSNQIQCWVQDKANNQSYIISGVYYIDKTLPSGVFTPNSSTLAINNLTTSFNPFDSGGSGVKQWRYRTSSNNGSTYGAWSNYITGDTTSNITLPTQGYWSVQAEVTDNAGNLATVTSGMYNVIIPKPTNNSLIVTKYDYKESNTIYWVKPNSIFGIYTDGYFPSSYGVYPSRTYVLFAKDNLFNLTTSARQYSTTTGKVKGGSEYDNNFNFDSTNTDLAQQFVLNGNNYLKATHHLSAKYDNTAYKLYHATTYVNGSEYYNSYVDSGIWLKVDGIAPNGTVDLNYYNVTSEMKITVTNIIETGSGVNKIWAEYTDKDNPLNIKTEELTNINGNYQGQENLYDLFSGAAETVNIKIKAIDNVGNERTLSDTDTNMFIVNANITRVLEPHDPVFKSGEKGILNINVYGGVDTLKITFPTELTTLDNTLNKQITLTPKVSDTVNNEFYIPINTLNNSYCVEVKAYRKGKEKIVYPPFTVNGNILNNLRTRIRKGN